MAINDIMLIAESPGFGMLGNHPFGDFPPFTIGANLQGLAVFNGTWPFANLMTTTSAWEVESGTTGTYDISLDDEVLELSGDIVLRKYISLIGGDTESPQLGVYNVRWDGDGEVSVPLFGLGFTSGGTAQFTVSTWNEVMDIQVRGGTISNLVVLEPDVDFVDYDAGEIFSPRWLNFVNQFNYRVIRTMDWSSTNGNLVSDWSERTHVNALSYQSTKEYNTRLWNYEGTHTAFIPYEVQCQTANTLNCDLWLTIPTRASNDYIQQLGALVESELNSNLNVYVEYSNETWNALFYDTQAWVNYLGINHREGNTVVGTNFVSTVSAHGLSEGQEIRILQSPTADTRTVFGDQIFGNGLTFVCNNVTTNTFELTISGSGDPVVFKTGLTSILWHPVDEAPLGIQVETTDFNHGQKSIEVWDNFRIGFTDHDRIIEVLAGQADFVQRGINRASAQGSNGRFDIFSIAPYFTGGHAYQAGDTDTDMYNDGIPAVEEALMYVDQHLDSGLSPMGCYEGGQHMLPTDAPGQGTIEELTQRFADFNNSPEMGLLYQQLLQGCSNRGLDTFCLFVGDVGRWSQFGYWGIKNSWADPDNGKVDVISEYFGTVPATGNE